MSDPNAQLDVANPDPNTGKNQELDAVIAERDTLKTQIRDLKNASKGFTDLQKAHDALQASFGSLQADHETFKTSVKQAKVDTHIQTALNASGAHNPARVKAMLDMSKLQIADDGTIDQESVLTQINALKTSDAYLFKPEGTAEGNQQSSTPGTDPKLPGVQRAAQGFSTDAYKEALLQARKAKDPFKAIEEVIEKFRK